MYDNGIPELPFIAGKASRPMVMYGAKCAETGRFLGMSWAKPTSEPGWCFVQTHGFCDGRCPSSGPDFLSKPICQSFLNLEGPQYHEDGYVTCWDSPEGRRTYTFRKVVFDEKFGVWGEEVIASKAGKPMTITG